MWFFSLLFQLFAIAAVPIAYDLFCGTEKLVKQWETEKGRAELLFLMFVAWSVSHLLAQLSPYW